MPSTYTKQPSYTTAKTCLCFFSYIHENFPWHLLVQLGDCFPRGISAKDGAKHSHAAGKDSSCHPNSTHSTHLQESTQGCHTPAKSLSTSALPVRLAPRHPFSRKTLVWVSIETALAYTSKRVAESHSRMTEQLSNCFLLPSLCPQEQSTRLFNYYWQHLSHQPCGDCAVPGKCWCGVWWGFGFFLVCWFFWFPKVTFGELLCVWEREVYFWQNFIVLFKSCFENLLVQMTITTWQGLTDIIRELDCFKGHYPSKWLCCCSPCNKFPMGLVAEGLKGF